ncbi:calcium uptake protein 3, mitochondrial isoform X1 [Cynoglossus semilaevis]|uniref:calcium uptake protein 3, mitochondrial isoform X1 n=2 Tax=Cynoglossus semilaevis TaxID=244447 RepID=UPI000D62FC5D|nr:calcium uptake protein 3, mitochondrial-like isoform X1 [Cynoglossus semilaevis]XP_024918930.1 calcium uptake protein 3, mitochondrial-like isoform X1 [Cynoglossus semilaevis]XP_024918931.1 calcium uptake protein 3, mitochondrial-like isoform X1 [Cynoglossus semilaevis]XP_024918932.1 calcium uptake protein 3, mitochondrial-like isoform X1 [Cynoglossus semilaevis]XP_024918933.1 calcium uptake protein 3, mitochondrial-like isoform X1 [Cynoglossus semilaevis]XP_024918934.1 calcium uptake prote
MASLRRLLSSAAAGRLLFVAPGQRTSALKVVAAGACAGAAFYYYYLHHRQRCWRSRVEARLSTLLLPSVCATDKARSYSLDDGDVYMSSYENRFRLFSSVEHEGQLFMTPLNFIESVTVNEPKSKRAWRSLTKKELDKMLADTPPVWKGSSNLFRNLRERGVISYTEYLFLLCILTKPHAGFRIAFNMFDADGNEMVDKREFLVLEEIFRKKKDRKEVGDVERLDQQNLQLYGHRKSQLHNVLKKDSQHVENRGMWDVLRRRTSHVLFSDLSEGNEKTETTLLVHFFGKKGKAELKFEDFYKFMDNLQTEVLEIEFLSYSKGMPTISEEDFARILLRYTNVDDVNSYLESVRHSIPDEKGITFEEFRSFFQFLNNLEDFAIAMQMYNFAHRSIGQEEFARAVYVATGIKLTRHLVNTVFKIFDEDHDDKLSHKEFIGVMKERLHRGSRVRAAVVFKHPTVVQWFEHTLNSAATSCHHTHTHTRTEVKLLSTEIFLNKY